MSFFADIGCDHIMVDMPDSAPPTFRGRYDTLGRAIANSSNPNMVFGKTRDYCRLLVAFFQECQQ